MHIIYRTGYFDYSKPGFQTVAVDGYPSLSQTIEGCWATGQQDMQQMVRTSFRHKAREIVSGVTRKTRLQSGGR